MTISAEELLGRTTFASGHLDLAVSGGADSTALALLAHAAHRTATLHHVDHGLRLGSEQEADAVGKLAKGLGFSFVSHRVEVQGGSNLEARARAARFSVLPEGVATGHTADDRAASVLMNLLRGAGPKGLSTLRAGPRHPILQLRRHETVALCQAAGVEVVFDPSNDSDAHLRNRVRKQLLPLADALMSRDVAALINRTADVVGTEDDYLDGLAIALIPDPFDIAALRNAHPVLVARRLRQMLTVEGYGPSSAELSRINSVIVGQEVACEISRGRRIARSKGRLIVG